MRTIYDPMTYQPHMQQLDSQMFEEVQTAMQAFEQTTYTAKEVQACPAKHSLHRAGVCSLAFSGSTAISGTDGRKGKERTRKAFRQLRTAVYTALYLQLL